MKSKSFSSVDRAALAPAKARWVALAAALYVLAGGAVSLVGWITGIHQLKDWWLTGIEIKANASLVCIAAGSALMLAILRPTARGAILVLAFATAALGGLTLLEHLAGVDLGIDTLLFDEAPGAAATAAPGRMGPPASASFFVLGIALALSQAGPRARSWSIALALPVLAIGTLSLTGYWYGALQMYALPRLTAIALQTATMVTALSIGVMAALPEHQPANTLFGQTESGTLARRLVITAFAVPLVLGWLRVVGQHQGLYDFAFGAALRTVIEIATLVSVVWWSVRAIRVRDRKREHAERERETSEQRMRLVLEASAVPFTVLTAVIDRTGTIVDFSLAYLNEAAARTLLRNPSDLIGAHLGQIYPNIWQQADVFDAMVAVAQTNDIREFETQFSPDATQRWFKVVASPLKGQVAVWFADVSEAKRQELELRAADRRKDEFLAILAHELRNPLAPIRQAAVAANKATATDAQRQWCNEVIERQVQHMSLLLDDLIDVSRITGGKFELRRKTTALAAIIDASVETSRPLIDRKGHALKIELPDTPVLLNVDPLRIAQVVSNLLNNAAKYTGTGGSIRLAVKVVDHALLVSVADTGIGITHENLTEIFKMFSQIKSAEEKAEGGLGIGLALTKGLVELHGGTITVASPGLGGGSTFSVTIPGAVASAASMDGKNSAAQFAAVPRRVLVADDNRDAAESLAMLLRLDGHEVAVANDGEEALRTFGVTAPDVVLLDIGMPRLSGYEVAVNIRRQNKPVLLVAITGWGQSHDRAKAVEAGFDHHLTKPVDYEVLAALLSRKSAE